ncbi:ead/Ea22-like family protein [Citrobacter sp. Cb130]|uniref:ead/Ea22-like family protein n=1 Tax=Citrobacter sp. Cb130 TaxID=2985033 RepID=UPI0025780733|nr:ead/Ea22-like family protein [Citrobacter sp. Cb130]MDM3328701.1 ead/Ea22-like family protein [Citrobacter sp. Cb130]
MTALNKQALREAAQEEIMLRSVSDTSDAWQDEASPEAVLALLGEMEAAENRIAELETREVMLPTPYPKGYGLAADKYNFALEECADAIRAAGIVVKGE